MWKIVIGFGSVIFFIALIAIAIYYIKQYLDEKNAGTHDQQRYDFNKNSGSVSGDILRELDQCINFLLSLLKSLSANAGNVQAPDQGLEALSQEIIIPLEKMMRIIERYPDKSKNMQDVTEYIIPLIKKLADDYCFYYQHSSQGSNSGKVMKTCEEGLKGISRILYLKADSMLEDQFYDIHAEVAALLQLHSINVGI